MTLGKVLVATDLGAAADEAIRQGDRWARAMNAELIVCHITGEDAPYWSFVPVREAELRARAVATASRAELLVQKRVHELTDREEVRVITRPGRPEAEICALAEVLAPDLVVVGSRDLHGIDRLIAGSVAERVVRYASTPVLVARPSPDSGGVLAATDFSDPAAPALAFAAKIASLLGAPLTLMHALDMTPSAMMSAAIPFGGIVVPLPVEDQEAVREAASSMLREQLRQQRAVGEILVEDGSPATAIIEAATRLAPRLVVLGTRGKTGLTRLALGSVAERVVDEVRSSVLVVRLRA